MKKLGFVMTLMLVMSLLLAACSGGNNNQGNEQGTGGTGSQATSEVGTGLETEAPGAGNLPGTGATSSPEATLGSAATSSPEATSGAEATASPEATSGAGMATASPEATSGAGTGSGSGAQATGTAVLPNTGMMDTHRLSNLLGFEVRNLNGDVLGNVDNIIVNLQNACLDYVVISSGGFLGIGAKNIPIPYEMLTLVAPMDNTGGASGAGTGSSSGGAGVGAGGGTAVPSTPAAGSGSGSGSSGSGGAGVGAGGGTAVPGAAGSGSGTGMGGTGSGSGSSGSGAGEGAAAGSGMGSSGIFANLTACGVLNRAQSSAGGSTGAGTGSGTGTGSSGAGASVTPTAGAAGSGSGTGTGSSSSGSGTGTGTGAGASVDQGYFLFNGSDEMLKNAPDIELGNFPVDITPGWDDVYFTYWTTARSGSAAGSGSGASATPTAGAAGSGSGSGTGSSGAGASVTPTAGAAGSGTGTGTGSGSGTGTGSGSGAGSSAGMKGQPMNRLVLASDLFGYNVDDGQGNSLGEIQDAIVDPQSGRVMYLVLSAGESLGMGNKWILVPVQAFSLGSADNTFSFNMDQSILSGAPSFDADMLPSMSGANTWDTDLQSYWSTNMPGSSTGSSTTNP